MKTNIKLASNFDEICEATDKEVSKFENSKAFHEGGYDTRHYALIKGFQHSLGELKRLHELISNHEAPVASALGQRHEAPAEEEESTEAQEEGNESLEIEASEETQP